MSRSPAWGNVFYSERCRLSGLLNSLAHVVPAHLPDFTSSKIKIKTLKNSRKRRSFTLWSQPMKTPCKATAPTVGCSNWGRRSGMTPRLSSHAPAPVEWASHCQGLGKHRDSVAQCQRGQRERWFRRTRTSSASLLPMTLSFQGPGS